MREDQGTTEVNTQKQKPNASSDTKNGKPSKWNPVLLPLDPNFLRLNLDRGDCEATSEFAIMLQNEEFLNELRLTILFILYCKNIQ